MIEFDVEYSVPSGDLAWSDENARMISHDDRPFLVTWWRADRGYSHALRDMPWIFV